MQIGVSSYSFAAYRKQTGCSYLALCDKAKELGFAGIEFIDLEGDDPLKTAAEIREHCEKIGLAVIAYTVSADFMADDPEKTVEAVCHKIDICEALGAKLLRHDVCYSLPADPLFGWEDAVARMAPYIRRVTAYAAEKGICTCTENHGYIFQKPERVEALIRAVGHKNYGWLCDMGNFLCADADPVLSVTTAARYAFHVHAKDFLFKEGGTEQPDGFFPTAGRNWLRGTVVGHGVVPVAQCLEILKTAGYDGWVSLEFEGPEDPLAALLWGLQYLQKHI